MGQNKRRVIVWGAGGHGKVVVDALLACDCWEVMGIIDDDEGKVGQKILGIPVVGSGKCIAKLVDELKVGMVAIAIGNNYVRDLKFREAREIGLKPANGIHPRVHMSRFVEL